MRNLQPNQFGQESNPMFAMTDAQVAQHKAMSRDAFGKAKAYRESGDVRNAAEAMRYGAVYREQARRRSMRSAGNRTTWAYGDTRNTRRLP